MNKLPYIQPEREIHYNLGTLLLILEKLAQTSRKKKVLTIDKIQTFHFLVTRPAFLNKVLMLANKRQIAIDDVDYYTVDTLSVNVDELFDRERLLAMIKILSSKEYLAAEYSKSEGFLFDLTDTGKSISRKLKDGHFRKITLFIEQLSLLQSHSPSKLNGYINTALKQGV
ncbi:ABC-three component system middle component 4 [Halomonas sp. YLGW01]|uniref:ABC-three component system middle component 4 n=1 Tax=Halomonas sp. YLGW01 TaxID=2773308 RepID=UPI0017871363|nr:ABC-three component system middle component 4 [Halomonas sp. YLGW01]